VTCGHAVCCVQETYIDQLVIVLQRYDEHLEVDDVGLFASYRAQQHRPHGQWMHDNADHVRAVIDT